MSQSHLFILNLIFVKFCTDVVKKSSSGSKLLKQNGQIEALCFSMSHTLPEGDHFQSFSAFFFLLFIHLHGYKRHAHTSIS